MAISSPVGTIRHNPNTYMQEVWDGKDWNPIVDTDNFTTIPVHNLNGVVSTNVYTTTISPQGGSMSDNTKENFYHFLKENIRVAEYLDESGKIDYVQLEIREGDGFVWEPIRRIKIKP